MAKYFKNAKSQTRCGQQNTAFIYSGRSFTYRVIFVNSFCILQDFATHVGEDMKGDDNMVYVGMEMIVWMTE
jgi:hypothetical protein